MKITILALMIAAQPVFAAIEDIGVEGRSRIGSVPVQHSDGTVELINPGYRDPDKSSLSRLRGIVANETSARYVCTEAGYEYVSFVPERLAWWFKLVSFDSQGKATHTKKHLEQLLTVTCK